MKMADKNALLLQGQREGLAKALEIVRQGGIEALEKECANRGATRVPLQVPTRAVEDCVTRIKNCTLDTMMVLSAYVLYEYNGFSFKQIEKFIADMESESDNLQSFEDWENYIKHIKDKTGIEMKIRRNDCYE